jgi:hypothetical protein
MARKGKAMSEGANSHSIEDYGPGTIGGERLKGFDLSQMVVCRNCGEMAGPWRLLRGTQGWEQLCACQSSTLREQRIEIDQWIGFDFNELATLCYGCGTQVLRSGWRFSVWFCDDCKARVRRINEEFQFALIPIGRHSLMAGVGLNGSATRDEARIQRFVDQLGSLGQRVDVLRELARDTVRLNLERMAGGEQAAVSLVDYLHWLHGRTELRQEAFHRLCDRFLKGEDDGF